MKSIIRGIYSEKITSYLKPKESIKITQALVAKMFKVSVDVVYNWENRGKKVPTSEDETIVYSRELRESGNIEALLQLVTDFTPQKKLECTLNPKKKVHYDEGLLYNRIDE